MSRCENIRIREVGSETKRVELCDGDPRKSVLDEVRDGVVKVVLREPSTIGPGYAASGFIVDNFVITNDHVVNGHKMISVVDQRGRSHTAEVIRIHESKDLALLKVNWSDGQAPKNLKLANRMPNKDEAVFAFGYPVADMTRLRSNRYLNVSSGQAIGIRDNYYKPWETVETYNKLQPDEKAKFKKYIDSQFYSSSQNIFNGNSGGPQVNMRGEVIGAIVTRDEDGDFARSRIAQSTTINDIKDLLRSNKSDWKVQYENQSYFQVNPWKTMNYNVYPALFASMALLDGSRNMAFNNLKYIGNTALLSIGAWQGFRLLTGIDAIDRPYTSSLMASGALAFATGELLAKQGLTLLNNDIRNTFSKLHMPEIIARHSPSKLTSFAGFVTFGLGLTLDGIYDFIKRPIATSWQRTDGTQTPSIEQIREQLFKLHDFSKK